MSFVKPGLQAAIFSGLILCVSTTQAEEWQVTRKEQVVVRHHPADAENAELVLDVISERFRELADALGYEGPMAARIILSGSQSEFNMLTGGAVPEWGEASTDYSRSVIVLKSPLFTGSSRREFSTTTVHEMAHLLIGEVVTAPLIPRWFNEGCAVYLSNEEDFFSSVRIARAMYSRSLIPLDEVGNVLSFQRDKASLAYAQSRAAVEFLVALKGNEIIRKLLVDTQIRGTFREAFRGTVGLDLLDFEIAFRGHLKEKYRLFFFAAVDDYIWALVPLLFIIAYLAVKFRSRRIVKRWEEEKSGGTDWSD